MKIRRWSETFSVIALAVKHSLLTFANMWSIVVGDFGVNIIGTKV